MTADYAGTVDATRLAAAKQQALYALRLGKPITAIVLFAQELELGVGVERERIADALAAIRADEGEAGLRDWIRDFDLTDYADSNRRGW